ncbi:MAG TPA: hypothetical protein ENN27_02535 [Candidatus Atribacteria bacterium]|nr:hypothetical protein [Candidatus Atribacteria bacterium]
MRITKLYKLTSVALMVTLLLFTIAPLQVALAAPLLDKSDTMTSLKVDTPSDHSIVFRTPSGVHATTSTITVTFPAEFAMGSVAFGDMELDHSAGGQSSCDGVAFSNSETLAASAGVGEWGVSVSGQVITFTPPTDATTDEIANNACVRINIGDTNKITNPDTADNYAIAIAGGFGDTGDIYIIILDDDQVLITATVDEILTFTISENEITFGTLSASTDRYADATSGSDTEVTAHNLIAGTNAVGGYAITTIGNTLTYGSTTIDAIGNISAASATGTEQFGLRMEASGGEGVVSAPFATTAEFAFQADTLQEVASSAVSSADTTYSVRYLANIASNTPAGPYTATLTYVATATF